MTAKHYALPASLTPATISVRPVIAPYDARRVFANTDQNRVRVVPPEMACQAPTCAFEHLGEQDLARLVTASDEPGTDIVHIKSKLLAQMLSRDFYIRRGLLSEYSGILPQLARSGDAYIQQLPAMTCLKYRRVGTFIEHVASRMSATDLRQCYLQLVLTFECLFRVACFTHGKLIHGSVTVTELSRPVRLEFPTHVMPNAKYIAHPLEFGAAGASIRWDYAYGRRSQLECDLRTINTGSASGDFFADVFGLTRLFYELTKDDHKYYEHAISFFTNGNAPISKFALTNRAFESSNSFEDFLRHVSAEYLIIERPEPDIRFRNDEAFDVSGLKRTMVDNEVEF